MVFVTPEKLQCMLDLDIVALEVNMLLSDKLKIQTIHNHSTSALKDGDLSKYLEKSLIKAYFKYVTKHEEVS